MGRRLAQPLGLLLLSLSLFALALLESVIGLGQLTILPEARTADQVSGHASDYPDLSRLRALGSRRDHELDSLTLLKGLESAALDLREMSEQVFAAVLGRDETEAFGFVEPFGRALCHLPSLMRE
jgi:hypothetical protein